MSQEALSNNLPQEVTAGKTPGEPLSPSAQMLLEMQGHRANLRAMFEALTAVNLRRVSNKELEDDYIARVAGAVNCVMLYRENTDILRFVKSWQEFQEKGEDVIIGFNDALEVWEKYILPAGVSPSVFDEAKDVFQKRLRTCRSKIEELLAVFQDFEEPSVSGQIKLSSHENA